MGEDLGCQFIFVFGIDVNHNKLLKQEQAVILNWLVYLTPDYH